MYRELSDLRVLRLALNVEETFERYEEELRNRITQAPVRAHLAPLFEKGPAHRHLQRAYEARGGALRAAGKDLDAEDVLQTLFDCEAAAHAFYLTHLDQLSDPALVKLFRELANEERAHMETVSDAMALHRQVSAERHAGPVA